MTNHILKFIAHFVVIIFATTALTHAQSFPIQVPLDDTRNVMSFSKVLENAIESVVLIHSGDNNSGGAFEPKSVGSGVVIDSSNGIIVTNSHVVGKSTNFRIQLYNHRWMEAELLGQDAATDIAVLKVAASLPRQIVLADSDIVKMGDLVFALGYPLGLQQSLSFGIVSGLGRTSCGAALGDFIQTDAAINSGNSGGALLNSNGELIGINTSILSKSGGNIGIGFSVPSRMAISVASQLSQYGEVKRGSLGIVIDHVNEVDSDRVGIDHWNGAVIRSIEIGSPAHHAGLKVGDVITKFDGRYIKSAHALQAWIGVSEAGKSFEITFIREGKAPQSTLVSTKLIDNSPISSIASMGAVVRELNEQDSFPSDLQGVLIEKLKTNSPAYNAGLLINDVIISVNNEFAITKQVCDRLINEAHGVARFIVYRSGKLIPILIQF